MKAGISGYAVSDFFTDENEPITMALVPEMVFSESGIHLEEGDRHNERHERITKMAIHALGEACSSIDVKNPVQLVVALSNTFDDSDGLTPLIIDLENSFPGLVSSHCYRKIIGDRATGFEAIDFAFR